MADHPLIVWKRVNAACTPSQTESSTLLKSWNYSGVVVGGGGLSSGTCKTIRKQKQSYRRVSRVHLHGNVNAKASRKAWNSSKATLGEFIRDRVECKWTFLRMQMLSWTELNWSALKRWGGLSKGVLPQCILPPPPTPTHPQPPKWTNVH